MSDRCQKCGRPAVYRVTRLVKGKPTETLFCEEHAQEASPYIPKVNSLEQFQNLLKSAVESAGAKAASSPERPEIPDVRCPSCGLAFEAYKRTLLLGCPDCYTSFEEHMTQDLRKFHGEVRHIGRSPSGSRPERGLASAANEMAARTDHEAAAMSESPTDAGSGSDPDQDEVRRLLKAAVQREDFEEAARLRDRLRSLERKKV